MEQQHNPNHGRSVARIIIGVWRSKMSRTAWSNLFVGLAAVNLALAFLPQNPLRMLDWIALPACIALGAAARRRMA
jgi:hypothetical protein